MTTELQSPELQSLELQLFSWEKCEEIGTMYRTFDNCILKVAIGGNPPGTKCCCINLDGSTSRIELFDEKGDDLGIYGLQLMIGERQDTPNT